jgi:hypothetical protein
MSNDDLFSLKLTEVQYTELAQLWREYTVLGPSREQLVLDRAGIALDFSEWIDTDEDYPRIGLPEIEAFFDEKERREGTALPDWAKE